MQMMTAWKEQQPEEHILVKFTNNQMHQIWKNEQVT
jgi:hypothetical protein